MLYIVATPIGNLKDISLRAIEVLEKVDFLLAEDTRRTEKLLAGLKIKNKPQMLSFFEGSEERRTAEALERLRQGQDGALVTDGGTPLVSDPGWRLVKRCQDKGIAYTALPGACAAINALVLSGLPTGRFSFWGFLPKRKLKRQGVLRMCRQVPGVKIFYESPLRLAGMLVDIETVFGQGVQVSVCREMTKRFEEVVKGRVDEVKQRLAGKKTRGEVTVLVM